VWLKHCSWEYKLVQLLWKSVYRFLKKLKPELPYNSPLPLIGIYRKESNSAIKYTYISMFIEALFIKSVCVPTN
jgi:hypothetical protein